MRLIDADRLKAFFIMDLETAICICKEDIIKFILTEIERSMITSIDECPTIDPVHAAGGCYCRECKWRIGEDEFGDGFCSNLSGIDDIVLLNDFCSYGERKNENEV